MMTTRRLREARPDSQPRTVATTTTTTTTTTATPTNNNEGRRRRRRQRLSTTTVTTNDAHQQTPEHDKCLVPDTRRCMIRYLFEKVVFFLTDNNDE
jgi:hypothetical protein